MNHQLVILQMMTEPVRCQVMVLCKSVPKNCELLTAEAFLNYAISVYLLKDALK